MMMPRTKQIRKKSSMNKRHHSNGPSATDVILTDSVNLHCDVQGTPPMLAHELVAKEYESFQDFQQELNTYYDGLIEKHNVAFNISCEEVKKMFCNILQQLPDAIKLSSVHGDVDVGYLGEQQEELNPEPDATVSQISRKPMDTTVLKPSKTPRKINTRASTRRRSLLVAKAPVPQVEVFKTPLLSARRLLPAGATITPKIYSATPITVMRRPLHGEMAISLSGSPLMVGATSCEDIPTVNVPLRDGRIFSIMPEAGAPPFDLPFFDETTRRYLQTLRDNLKIIAPNSPKQY